MACAAVLAADSSRPLSLTTKAAPISSTNQAAGGGAYPFTRQTKVHGEAMTKQHKGSKKAKKLVKTVKKEAKKEKKKSNIEVDRSDVKPPSPFSS